MQIDEAVRVLRENRSRLDEYHVQAVYLFGSLVRGDAGPSSDVDVLVEFEPGVSIGLISFARLQRLLTELLGRPVDLATPDSLHKALRDTIWKEAIRAT